MSRSYSLAAVRALANGGLGAVVPPPLKRRRNEESVIQVNLIRWWGQHCREFHVPSNLLMSIPNGGFRNARTGAVLKLEGLRPGAPDLLLAVARTEAHSGSGNSETPRSFHGLFIELKTPIGVVGCYQKKMLSDLEYQGYLTAVCRSFEDARTVITNYLRQ